jgi:branched-chain amino acid transport system substrate-binding protein
MSRIRTSRLRLLALLACCALLAACGQKEGVHTGRQVGFSDGSGGATDPGFDASFEDGFEEGFDADSDGVTDLELDDGSVADPMADGAPADDGGASGGDAGPTGGGAAPACGDGAPAGGAEGTPGGASAPAPGNGGDGGGNGGGGDAPATAAGTQQPAGGDTTGVSDDLIKIGVHAPITGAAPIPQQSVEAARQQFWDANGPVHGREVEVIIRDDQYNPSRATSVCNELIQRQEVFLLAGVGGVDQIAACARTAAQQGVPYLSAGTVEGALRQLPNYFSVSMSYKQQATLVMQWVQRNSPPSNGRFGIVRDRTPNFGEVVTEMERLAKAAGYEVLIHQVSNAPSAAQWLAQNQIEVAFPIMAPSLWVQIVNSPGGSIDQWIGVGPTMGLNSVASASCPSINGAVFFSSWSGLNQTDRLDPGFNRAGGGDDIMWASWGQNKAMATVFEDVGPNLTREAFINHIRTNEIKTGVVPTLRHSAEDNFGVSEQHMLVANCSSREFETPEDGLFVRAR